MKRRCMVCGEQISEADDAAPLTCGGASLVGPDGPVWAHRSCFLPRALADMEPETTTRQ
jgi:hypothetical protein